MDLTILLLGCCAEVEKAARGSSLAAYCTIQAVCDLRQPEVVSLVREADLVLLHESAVPRDLPDICRHLRRQTNRPLLVLLSAREEVTAVAVLGAGADDCLPDTLSGPELVARLRAHLRRDREYAVAPGAGPCEHGELRVDTARHEVSVRGRPVNLTPREFELLERLARRAGRPVRRDELLERVWGYNSAMSTRTLDVHVGRLRQKIENDPHEPKLIITVPGVGYKLAT